MGVPVGKTIVLLKIFYLFFFLYVFFFFFSSSRPLDQGRTIRSLGVKAFVCPEAF